MSRYLIFLTGYRSRYTQIQFSRAGSIETFNRMFNGTNSFRMEKTKQNKTEEKTKMINIDIFPFIPYEKCVRDAYSISGRKSKTDKLPAEATPIITVIII